LTEETVGFQSLRMRSFRNGKLVVVEYEIIPRYGTSESHMQKVSAIRLFHPTASPVLFGTGSCHSDTVSPERE